MSHKAQLSKPPCSTKTSDLSWMSVGNHSNPNAGSCYAGTVRPGLWAPELRRTIAGAALEAGGPNGLVIEADGGNGCHNDPDWGEPPWVATG
jgi:hypothetical protein